MARVKKRTDTSTNRESDKIISRLPKGMRANLARLADQRGRSANAEVVRALTQYLNFELGVKPEAKSANEGYLLSEHGLYNISKRLEAGVGALEQLFFDARDRRVRHGPAQIVLPKQWRAFLRLSLVTCPVTLTPATDAEGLDNIAHSIDEPVSLHAIEIDEFVPRGEIDPRYLIRPYYLRPDGKVGHDAFALIRETIRATDKVAIARFVMTNREQIIALDPLDKGLMGTLLRYPHEVRHEKEYFQDIQDVKITKDMLDLAKHIVEQKSGHFEPGKYENHYKNASTNPRVDEQNNRPTASKGSGNVINLLDALRKSVAGDKPNESLAAAKK